jgi:ribosomal protein S18 acetylase RimI-like enzyme
MTKSAPLPPAELVVKNLEPNEFNELFSTLIQIYLASYQSYSQYAYKTEKRVHSYLKWLYHHDPHGFFIAQFKNKVIGWAASHANWEDWMEGEVGEVHELVVEPTYQRKRVGQRLMKEVLNYFTSQGREKATLWVGEKNQPARNFYSKLGFVQTRQADHWIRMVYYITSPPPTLSPNS